MEHTSARSQCGFCNSKKISSTLILKKFPIAPRSTKVPRFENFDFNIGFCEECFLVQQLNEVDPTVLYEEFKNDVIGDKLNNQKISFLKYVTTFLKQQMTVLEMGSGNGLIVKQLAEVHKSIKFIANDYNLNFENELPNIEKLNGDLHEYALGEIDMIFSSHVFEHIVDAKSHIKKVNNILRNGGFYIIAIPLFETWIKNLNLNSFTPEHPIYPFEDDLILFFNKAGFEKVSSECYLDHSLYISFMKVDCVEKVASPKSKQPNLEKFSKNLENLSKLLENIMKKHKKIVLWGANSSTQLIYSLMNINNWNGNLSIVDNSELKVGGYLFGSDIRIESPKTIGLLDKNDAVVIMLGTFDDEVKQQCKQINSNVKIYDKSFIVFDK